MRKFILLLILLIIASTQCYAQGVSHTNIALYNAAGFAKPVPSAVITVCTANDTAIPCINTVSLFTNFALTTVLSNPFNADANGNYSFFVAPGNYTVTVTGVGITGFSYQVSLGTGTPSSLIGPGVISGTFSGNHTTTGNNTHTGTETFTNTVTGGKINGNCIVDGVQNATLAAAVTCAGSSGVIEVPMFAVPALTGNVTIPVGVTLQFVGPSGITTTGFTLTINGSVVAPSTQIFFGTGTVTFNNPAQVAYASWFPGADWAAKTNAAYAANPNGTIFIPASLAGSASTSLAIASPNSVREIFDQGTFTYTGAAQEFVCTSVNAAIIEGSGFQGGGSANGTIFSVTNTAANGFDINVCPGAMIRNLTIVGPGSGTGKGLIITGNSAGLENIVVKSFGGNGCEEDGTRGNSNGVRYWGVRCVGNGGIGFNSFGANGNLNDLYELEVSGNTGLGMQMTTCCNFFAPVHAFSNNAGGIGITLASGAANNSGEIYSDIGTQTIDLAELAGSNNNGMIRLVSGQNFTDAGTNNFTVTSQMFGATNSAAVPFYSYQQDRTTGFWSVGSGSEGWSSAGVARLYLVAGSIRQGANQVYGWGSAADPGGGGNDTGFSRPSAGQVACGNGFTGNTSCKFRAALISADGGAVCTNGELALSAGWQSTGSATVTVAAGTGQTCSWTITTGTTTAANPTVTDTLTNTLVSAGTVCEMNIHGGTHTAAAGEGFTQTSLSATAPVFTFVGTPTAGGTTYFVTRRCGP